MAQEPLTNIQPDGGSKNYGLGTRLEDDGYIGLPSDVGNDQLRVLVEKNLLSIVRELSPELDVTYTNISNHLKQIGETNGLHYGVLSSLLLLIVNELFVD